MPSWMLLLFISRCVTLTRTYPDESVVSWAQFQTFTWSLTHLLSFALRIIFTGEVCIYAIRNTLYLKRNKYVISRSVNLNRCHARITCPAPFPFKSVYKVQCTPWHVIWICESEAALLCRDGTTCPSRGGELSSASFKIYLINIWLI